MTPINKALSLFKVRISRVSKPVRQISEREKEFLEKFDGYLKQIENNKRGFKVAKNYKYEVGEHPSSHIDLVCEFAAHHLYHAKTKPQKILDIGAWPQFIIGMLSHYEVTSIDFRHRESRLKNETVVTCDAKELNIPDNSFDAVLGIGGFYTFGLGRYGDEIDIDADMKSFNEMVRVLKPGGMLIFLATITAGEPYIFFNRCRIYNYEMIQKFCKGLECIEERYVSRKMKKFCSIDEINEAQPDCYDNYLGCWRKIKD